MIPTSTNQPTTAVRPACPVTRPAQDQGTPVNERDPQVWAAYQEQLRRQQGCVGCGG